jgi:hypothetical protein
MKKPVWETKNPAKKPKKMSPAQKQAAKAFAKKTGTKYPSLVANLQGMKRGK